MAGRAPCNPTKRCEEGLEEPSAPDSTTSMFVEGEEVLLHQPDSGTFALGRIVQIDRTTERCLLRFMDDAEVWAELNELRHIKDSAGMLCLLCKKKDQTVLPCPKCKRGYHRSCLEPGIPEGSRSHKWSCHRCSGKYIGEPVVRRRTRQSVDQDSPAKPLRNESPNSEEGSPLSICYCNKPGDWFLQMLQCLQCQRWFHQNCLSCLQYPLYCGDRFYVFLCSACNLGEEFARRLVIDWVDFLHLSLFNLTLFNAKKYFDLDREIMPYVKTNWFYMRVPKKMLEYSDYQLRETVLKHLQKNSLRFKCGRPTLWGLRCRAPPRKPVFPLPPHRPLSDIVLSSFWKDKPQLRFRPSLKYIMTNEIVRQPTGDMCVYNYKLYMMRGSHCEMDISSLNIRDAAKGLNSNLLNMNLGQLDCVSPDSSPLETVSTKDSDCYTGVAKKSSANPPPNRLTLEETLKQSNKKNKRNGQNGSESRESHESEESQEDEDLGDTSHESGDEASQDEDACQSCLDDVDGASSQEESARLSNDAQDEIWSPDEASQDDEDSLDSLSSHEETTNKDRLLRSKTKKIPQVPIKQEPTEQMPIELEPIEQMSIEFGPIKLMPIELEPIEQMSIELEPIEQIPIKLEPVKQISVEQISIGQIPIEEEPIEQEAVERMPIEQKPIEQEINRQALIITPPPSETPNTPQPSASPESVPSSVPANTITPADTEAEDDSRGTPEVTVTTRSLAELLGSPLVTSDPKPVSSLFPPFPRLVPVPVVKTEPPLVRSVKRQLSEKDIRIVNGVVKEIKRRGKRRTHSAHAIGTKTLRLDSGERLEKRIVGGKLLRSPYKPVIPPTEAEETPPSGVELPSTSSSSAKMGNSETPITFNDVKEKVRFYFNAQNRILAGEKYQIKGKRTTPLGSTEYLVEWLYSV